MAVTVFLHSGSHKTTIALRQLLYSCRMNQIISLIWLKIIITEELSGTNLTLVMELNICYRSKQAQSHWQISQSLWLQVAGIALYLQCKKLNSFPPLPDMTVPVRVPVFWAMTLLPNLCKTLPHATLQSTTTNTWLYFWNMTCWDTTKNSATEQIPIRLESSYVQFKQSSHAAFNLWWRRNMRLQLNMVTVTHHRWSWFWLVCGTAAKEWRWLSSWTL